MSNFETPRLTQEVDLVGLLSDLSGGPSDVEIVDPRPAEPAAAEPPPQPEEPPPPPAAISLAVLQPPFYTAVDIVPGSGSRRRLTLRRR